MVAEIGPILDVDRTIPRLDHANLITEGQVDRSRTYLIARERREPQPPGVDFGKDGITREHRHRTLHGTVRAVRHPYFCLPTPIVIGHRGCAGSAPENTLIAFERGLAAGAAILESDVHLTRDGVPVLLHDPVVDRVTNGSGPVANLPLNELQELDAGYHFSPDCGRTHPFRGQGLYVPTLEESLSAFPGVRFNLEIKADEDAAIAATADIISRSKRAALTLLTAENGDAMQRLRRHLTERRLRVAHGASIEDVLAVIRSAADGSPPVTPAMVLQIPLEFANRPLVTEALLAHAHAHGIQIHVWTINEEEDMSALLDLGVDGIITDHPQRLANLIEGRRSRAAD
jgi:glycerophosphoryl diester phosphodiesterase